ncbi:MAG: carbohydrate kinase, partial [bacterium]
MFLGFDSSTQSLSAIVLDADQNKIIAEASVNFGKDLPHYSAPSGFIPGGSSGEVHADPMMWVEALDLVLGKLSAQIDLSKVTMIAGSGQQHGSVYVNESFDSIIANLDPSSSLKAQLSASLTRSTSPIWMDTSTGLECAEIASAVGGNAEVCARSGSVMIERFTGSQIRKFSKQNPSAYAATSRVHLVSSFIASVLAGKSLPIDFGDVA